MDALRQALSSFGCSIHFLHFFVHFDEVVVDELIYDLGRQVDPYVENALLILIFEGILKIFLDIRHNHVCSAKVQSVPLAIRLLVSLTLLANRSVSEQVVNELDWEHFNLIDFFESRYVDVLTFGDVEEDAIDEKQECLHIEELAPWKAKIEEELC